MNLSGLLWQDLPQVVFSDSPIMSERWRCIVTKATPNPMKPPIEYRPEVKLKGSKSQPLAQPGSASALDAEGQRFKSSAADHPSSSSGRTSHFDCDNRGSNPREGTSDPAAVTLAKIRAQTRARVKRYRERKKAKKEQA